MTVTDRDLVPMSAGELEQLAVLEARLSSPRARGSAPALASLAAGAGVIHLAMAPSHTGEWLPEGIAFAAAGWVQLALAVLLVLRCSRRALGAAAAANAAFIGAWAVTRVSGMPWGPHAGATEDVTVVDGACVALEAVLAAGATVALLRRRPATAGWTARSWVVPAAVLALTTAVLVSPSAADHAHGSGVAGEAGEAAPHEHGTGGDVAVAPVDDLGLSEVMNGQGEGGGHTHDVVEVPLDAATQAALDAQLAQTRPLIDRYPTVAAAEADGYFRAGPFAPGLGAHYTGPNLGVPNPDGVLDADDLAHPTLIFDGIQPDSPLAGFMYLSFSLDTERAPEGFAGPNDHWHYHTNVCLVARPEGGLDAPLGADTTATQELCDRYGGFLIANTGYMLHVWTVPGYESPQGVFSNVNARITCADGTYHTVEPEDIGTRTSTCLDAA